MVMTLNPTFHGAVSSYYSTVVYTNFIFKNNFTFTILNEALTTSPIVFYLTKNFYLLGELNEKISQFKAGGMINYWMSTYFGAIPITSKLSSFTPTSLSLEQLEGIFRCFILGLSIATVAFVVEINFHRLQRIAKCCARVFKRYC